MKKLLSVLLAALMIVFSIPITAFAEEADVFTDDITSGNFILTPNKTDITPGESVTFSVSIKPDGRLYGFAALISLPDGFKLVSDQEKLADEFEKVRGELGWAYLEITIQNGNSLLFTGLAYKTSPYIQKEPLELPEFTCIVEKSGALSYDPTQFYALNSENNEVPLTLVNQTIEVDEANSCSFTLTSDRDTVKRGETVDFELSITPNGGIYGYQTYLSLPANLVINSYEAVNEWGWYRYSFSQSNNGWYIFGYNDTPYTEQKESIIARFTCEAVGTGFAEVGLTEYSVVVNTNGAKINGTASSFPVVNIIAPYTVTIPENVTVTLNGIELSDGDMVGEGEILTITAEPPAGFELSSLTVNGDPIENGGEFTVGNKDVVIEVDFEEKPGYTVEILSTNITVTCNGVTLKSGDKANTGDVLTITVNVPSGYRLKSLTVNGSAIPTISNSGTYTVGSENITIAANIELISSGGSSSGGSSGGNSSGGSSGGYGGRGGSGSSVYYTVSIPDNVVVTRNGVELKDGAVIYSYDELRIEAIVPEGKRIASLTVNGTAINNGDLYTVVSGNVYIRVTFEDASNEPVKYNITIPENVIVTRNNVALHNGDEISEGDILIISAAAPSGYKLSLLVANGVLISNGAAYRAGSGDVVISVSFEKLPEAAPSEPFVTSDATKRGWDAIYKLLSVPTETTIMIDMNGTTVLPQRAIYLLYNTGNKMLLKMNDKVSWSLDGKDVYAIMRDIDLTVTLGKNNIPDSSIKDLIGNRANLAFTLKHNGDLGFKAMLVIDVGEQYNDEKAALYWFNNNEFKLEGSCSVMYGLAIMEINHASEWLIAFEKAGSDPGNDPDNKPDQSDPGKTDPPPALPGNQQPSNPDFFDPSKSDPDDKDNVKNPNTGSRVSLKTFLALIAAAAACLFSRKPKQQEQ